MLHSPHVGGYLRQHSFDRCRAADKGGVDTVFGDRPRLLAHFGNLGRKKGLHLPLGPITSRIIIQVFVSIELFSQPFTILDLQHIKNGKFTNLTHQGLPTDQVNICQLALNTKYSGDWWVHLCFAGIWS